MKNFYYINQLIQRSTALKYNITRAGCGNVNPDFNIERGSTYPYCVIHYVAEGHGFVIQKNVKYSLKPGKIFILGPNEAHRYTSDPNSPFNLNWVEFSGGDSGRFVNYIIDILSPVADETPSKTVNRYILKILSLLKKDPMKYSMIISKLIYSILIFLYDQSSRRAYFSLTSSNLSDMSRVEDYINNNLHKDLSIEKLSGIANFSPTYFARLFHRVIGNTPSQYVLEKRLNKAKELLSEDHTKIKLISELLGFCNTSHFIKVFKKAEGMTPTEFRHQCMQFRQKPG